MRGKSSERRTDATIADKKNLELLEIFLNEERANVGKSEIDPVRREMLRHERDEREPPY